MLAANGGHSVTGWQMVEPFLREWEVTHEQGEKGRTVHAVMNHSWRHHNELMFSLIQMILHRTISSVVYINVRVLALSAEGREAKRFQ